MPDNQHPSDSGLRADTYHVERLDDVSTRLARIEGRMESFAKKEDIANAKLQLVLSWVGLSIMTLIGIGTIVARLWIK